MGPVGDAHGGWPGLVDVRRVLLYLEKRAQFC